MCDKKDDREPLEGGLAALADHWGSEKGFDDGREIRRAIQEIGAKIRSARKAAGLSQAGLAEQCGMQQSDISRLENGSGSKGPSIGTLGRVAQALGCRFVTDLEPATQDLREAELPENIVSSTLDRPKARFLDPVITFPMKLSERAMRSILDQVGGLGKLNIDAAENLVGAIQTGDVNVQVQRGSAGLTVDVDHVSAANARLLAELGETLDAGEGSVTLSVETVRVLRDELAAARFNASVPFESDERE